MRIAGTFAIVLLALSQPGNPAGPLPPGAGRPPDFERLRSWLERAFGSPRLDARLVEALAVGAVDRHMEWLGAQAGGDTSRRIPPHRAFLVKLALRQWFRDHRMPPADRIREDRAFGRLKEFLMDRGALPGLLASDAPLEIVSRKLDVILDPDRPAPVRASLPRPLGAQLEIPATEGDLRVVPDRVMLVSDEGGAGAFNGAVDAGEVVSLNVTLRNHGTRNYRSTSARLTTADPNLSVEDLKIVYGRAGGSGGGGEFPPGAEVTPEEHWVLFVSPGCPDGHKARLSVEVGDSDHGRSVLDLYVTIYNVGRILPGPPAVDDDDFGRSRGNGNRLLEPGETAEYVLPLEDAGPAAPGRVEVTLESPDPLVVVDPEFRSVRYERGDRPAHATFLLRLAEDRERWPQAVPLNILATLECRGHSYVWTSCLLEPVLLPSRGTASRLSACRRAAGEGDWITALSISSALARTRGGEPAVREAVQEVEGRWQALVDLIRSAAEMTLSARNEAWLALPPGIRGWKRGSDIGDSLFPPALTGLNAARDGDWTRARSQAEALLREVPEYPVALAVRSWARARSFESRGDRTAALKELEGAARVIVEAKEDLSRLQEDLAQLEWTAFFPLDVGATWFYHDDRDEWKNAIVGVEEIGGTACSVLKRGPETWHYSASPRGLFVHRVQIGQSVWEPVQPEVLRYPLRKGDRWTLSLRNTSSGGGTQEMTIECENLGQEYVRVPAGRYSAWKIAQKASMGPPADPTPTRYTLWYAPKVGVVQSRRDADAGHAARLKLFLVDRPKPE